MRIARIRAKGENGGGHAEKQIKLTPRAAIMTKVYEVPSTTLTGR